ncbi:MAG: efflux RND transporter periplasmic adaptor subunit [Chitinophagales bacterium]|nr:efflux RND transporter periplasmic adaptor subunit [Chitinophagales bacterium]
MKKGVYFSWFLLLSWLIVVSCNENKDMHQAHRKQVSMDMITFTGREELYAGIKTDTVKRKEISEFSSIVGTAAFDEQKITVVTARFRGRLEKLYVKTPQQYVTKGQPLYAIYSEELLSDEKELVGALEQQEKFSSIKQVIDELIAGARKKLLLWGLSPEQIATIEKTKKIAPLVDFYSPVSGTLVELSVSEGQYVEAGTALYRIADLSELWVEAQVYTNELQWLKEKPRVQIEFDAYPGELLGAKPVFENPALETDQKISLIRFLIDNRKDRIKPGMMGYVHVKRNERQTLVIPKTSILVGEMVTVWVKTMDNMYEPRSVKIGVQNKKEVEILSGLQEGEIVVTNGAFLLNSALILKKGAGMGDMGGMKM